MSEQLTGPFTIAYICEQGDTYTISVQEYEHLESVYAFIHGRNLVPGNYVVVAGEVITNINDLI